MARDTRYKLVLRDEGKAPSEFYDLTVDPHEKTNQYNNPQYVDMRDRLAGELAGGGRISARSGGSESRVRPPGCATGTNLPPCSKDASFGRWIPDLGGLRQLFQSIRLADGHADAQIAGGQHVRPAQREDQEHVSRPDADALDGGKVLDHLVVGGSRSRPAKSTVPARVWRARSRIYSIFCRERPSVAHARGPQLEQGFRGQPAAGRGDQPAVDDLRYLSAQLLRDN